MESRLTSANTSYTLGSSRGQAITWTLLGPDFYQINFNFLLSAAGIVQVATTTHHCMDGQIQLLPDFRGRQRQRSDSKLAAEPPHSRAMSHWDESQVSSKSDEELSSSFRKRLGCLFQQTRHSDKPSCNADIMGQASRLPLYKGTSLNPPVSKVGFARVRVDGENHTIPSYLSNICASAGNPSSSV